MAKRKSKDVQAEINVQVKLDVKSDTPSYYINYVGVSHTPYDFTLSMVKIPSPSPEEHIELAKSGKPIALEPVLQIVLPPLLVEGLIKALIDQKEKHAKTLLNQVKQNELQHKHVGQVGPIN